MGDAGCLCLPLVSAPSVCLLWGNELQPRGAGMLTDGSWAPAPGWTDRLLRACLPPSTSRLALELGQRRPSAWAWEQHGDPREISGLGRVGAGLWGFVVTPIRRVAGSDPCRSLGCCAAVSGQVFEPGQPGLLGTCVSAAGSGAARAGLLVGLLHLCPQPGQHLPERRRQKQERSLLWVRGV